MSLFIKLISLLSPLFLLPEKVFCASSDFGAGEANSAANLPSKIGEATDIPSLIGTVVGVGLSLIGVIFFLLILYAGIRWMTARGKEDEVTKSKEIIIDATIGLIIVLAAYAITNFVFTNLGVGGENNANTADKGGQNADDVCKDKADKTQCGELKECKNSKCVDKCVAEIGGTCVDIRELNACSAQTIDNFCPPKSDNNIKCCPPSAP